MSVIVPDCCLDWVLLFICLTRKLGFLLEVNSERRIGVQVVWETISGNTGKKRKSVKVSYQANYHGGPLDPKPLGELWKQCRTFL